jgi:hypothetical protein
MTTEEKQSLQQTMSDTAMKLGEQPQLTGCIIIGITRDVSDDQSKRRGLMVMTLKSEFDDYPLYIKMAQEILQQSLERGPTEQSAAM